MKLTLSILIPYCLSAFSFIPQLTAQAGLMYTHDFTSVAQTIEPPDEVSGISLLSNTCTHNNDSNQPQGGVNINPTQPYYQLNGQQALLIMFPFQQPAILRCQLQRENSNYTFNTLNLTFGVPENVNYPDAKTTLSIYVNDNLVAASTLSPGATNSLSVPLIDEATNLSLKAACFDTTACGEIYFTEANQN